MPVLEVFVAVLCVVVLLLVVLLTAITQLNPDTDSIWRWVRESMRVKKRDVVAKKPGRRARKTQRRERMRVGSPAAVTENATEPTNNLIGTGSSEIWSPVTTVRWHKVSDHTCMTVRTHIHLLPRSCHCRRSQPSGRMNSTSVKTGKVKRECCVCNCKT